MTFTPAETAACRQLIVMALREDFGDAPDGERHDATTELFTGRPDRFGAGALVARKPGIVAGLPAAELACEFFDPLLRLECVANDGQLVKPGDVLAHLRGSMSSILGIERTALNFLQHLSGIATLTNQYVQAVAGLPVKILDTRKTIPGWRLLAKYAVRQGGGHNHRMGLYDAILIKDNHIAFAGTERIGTFLRRARNNSRLSIEIEVETLKQLDEALGGLPDIILLDNMPLDQMREAVARRNAIASDVLLEASGGVNLQTVRAIAETGVDRISVGALTHSAPALDIALDYES